MALRPAYLLVAALTTGAVVARAGGVPRTRITVWAAAQSGSGDAFGGVAYGGYAPTSGALVTEHRELEIVDGEARLSGTAATLDPASVHLRDLTDPAAVVTEQRFVQGSATPTELLARHVGEQVTVLTGKGELTGALRAVDERVIVVEIGAGDQRRLEMMQRDGFVNSVRFGAGTGDDRPSLMWRVRTARPGRHDVELSYRTEGMSWAADYLAVLDEAGGAVDFSARATIKNATGASYDSAELTLIADAPASTGAAQQPPARFAIATPVRLAQGASVQLELVPPRLAAKARSVITLEAIPDPSPGAPVVPATDCSQTSGAGAELTRTDVAIELDAPARAALPDGKARLLRRRAGRLELVAEEPLRTGPGVVRIRVAPDHDITAERRAVTCSFDERAHTIRESIEVALDNAGAQAAEVIAREPMWRWPVWRIEVEGQKGARAGPQLQEYRVRVPAGGKATLTYAVVYAW